MKMQLGCDCCGPGKCSKTYHVNPGRQLWIGGNDTPISVSPATPTTTSSVILDTQPGTWIPDPREPDPLLGDYGVYGIDPQNYYNTNPDYWGHPHFLFPDLIKVDYEHPSFRRDGQFTSNDLMFQSGVDVPMFASGAGAAMQLPNCNLSRQMGTNTEIVPPALIGDDTTPVSIEKTFTKVPLQFDRNLSFIVDGKTVKDDWIDYWCSDAGSGQAIDQFALGVDPFVPLDYVLTGSWWYTNICERIGIDIAGTQSYGYHFITGVEMDGVKETDMTFTFNNGELRIIYSDGGYDSRGHVYGYRIASHEIIDTTPIETVPKHWQYNATGWYKNGGPNPDYGTIFLHRVSRAFYDHHGATTCDGFFMGKPLPMIVNPWRGQNEPMLLGNVTIKFNFVATGSMPFRWPGISGSFDAVSGGAGWNGAAWERTATTDWKDPAFETSLDLPLDAQSMLLQTYSADDISGDITNPRYPSGPFWTRGFITNQTSATISPDPMILRRHN